MEENIISTIPFIHSFIYCYTSDFEALIALYVNFVSSNWVFSGTKIHLQCIAQYKYRKEKTSRVTVFFFRGNWFEVSILNRLLRSSENVASVEDVTQSSLVVPNREIKQRLRTITDV